MDEGVVDFDEFVFYVPYLLLVRAGGERRRCSALQRTDGYFSHQIITYDVGYVVVYRRPSRVTFFSSRDVSRFAFKISKRTEVREP